MAVQDAQSNTVLDDETLRELGLTEQPFLENKKRQPVADSTALKTRAALEQHVRFGDSLHLLIGADGSGKTVLLQQLLKHCKSSIKPFVVKGSEEFQADALLYAVLTDLNKEEEHTAETTDELIEALEPIFEQITADQLCALLIIDDAHLAPIEEIAVLVDTLQRFETEDGKTARLLLTGTPALAQSIARYEEQFQDLKLQYSTTEMQPLDEARTQEYLSSRLHQAGFADAFPFTDKAIAKIQHDSGGMPGRINDSATHYLNGVYRNAGKGGAESGWFSSIEWPVLALGAAALGAIGIGLSMFFGNKPETEVIPVAANDTTTKIEQPVVAPTSVPNTLGDASTSVTQDTLVKPVEPVEPSFQSNNDDNSNSLNNGEKIPVIRLVEQEPTEPAPNEQVSNPQLPRKIVDSTTNNDRLVPPEEDEPAVQAATAEPTTPVLPANSTNPTDSPVAFDAPVPSESQLTALDKSVGNSNIPADPANQLTDNSLLSGANNDTANQDAADISTGNRENTGLLDGDTDAAAPALDVNRELEDDEDSSTIATSTTESTRAIENERWVLYQAPQKFTIQLATSRERSYIIDLAQTMEVKDPVAIYPFLTTNSNNPVFGLLSGLYDTRAEAIAAVESMNARAKKFGVWIRPVSDLQADIKRRK